MTVTFQKGVSFPSYRQRNFNSCEVTVAKVLQFQNPSCQSRKTKDLNFIPQRYFIRSVMLRSQLAVLSSFLLPTQIPHPSLSPAPALTHFLLLQILQSVITHPPSPAFTNLLRLAHIYAFSSNFTSSSVLRWTWLYHFFCCLYTSAHAFSLFVCEQVRFY